MHRLLSSLRESVLPISSNLTTQVTLNVQINHNCWSVYPPSWLSIPLNAQEKLCSIPYRPCLIFCAELINLLADYLPLDHVRCPIINNGKHSSHDLN